MTSMSGEDDDLEQSKISLRLRHRGVPLEKGVFINGKGGILKGESLLRIQILFSIQF